MGVNNLLKEITPVDAKASFKKLVKKRNFKIYDMRNMYSPKKMKKLNINYFGIGR